MLGIANDVGATLNMPSGTGTGTGTWNLSTPLPSVMAGNGLTYYAVLSGVVSGAFSVEIVGFTVATTTSITVTARAVEPINGVQTAYNFSTATTSVSLDIDPLNITWRSALNDAIVVSTDTAIQSLSPLNDAVGYATDTKKLYFWNQSTWTMAGFTPVYGGRAVLASDQTIGSIAVQLVSLSLGSGIWTVYWGVTFWPVAASGHVNAYINDGTNSDSVYEYSETTNAGVQYLGSSGVFSLSLSGTTSVTLNAVADGENVATAKASANVGGGNGCWLRAVQIG